MEGLLYQFTPSHPQSILALIAIQYRKNVYMKIEKVCSESAYYTAIIPWVGAFKVKNSVIVFDFGKPDERCDCKDTRSSMTLTKLQSSPPSTCYAVPRFEGCRVWRSVHVQYALKFWRTMKEPLPNIVRKIYNGDVQSTWLRKVIQCACLSECESWGR